jgi:hypothetical protein
MRELITGINIAGETYSTLRRDDREFATAWQKLRGGGGGSNNVGSESSSRVARVDATRVSPPPPPPLSLSLSLSLSVKSQHYCR